MADILNASVNCTVQSNIHYSYFYYDPKNPYNYPNNEITDKNKLGSFYSEDQRNVEETFETTLKMSSNSPYSPEGSGPDDRTIFTLNDGTNVIRIANKELLNIRINEVNGTIILLDLPENAWKKSGASDELKLFDRENEMMITVLMSETGGSPQYRLRFYIDIYPNDYDDPVINCDKNEISYYFGKVYRDECNYIGKAKINNNWEKEVS